PSSKLGWARPVRILLKLFTSASTAFFMRDSASFLISLIMRFFPLQSVCLHCSPRQYLITLRSCSCGIPAPAYRVRGTDKWQLNPLHPVFYRELHRRTGDRIW